MKYNITGTPMPVLNCMLEPNESMISESGSMSWMSPNMELKTTTNGGVGKVFSRMISGEKMFQNIYTARNGNGSISFASSFPGDIVALNVTPEQEYLVQKTGFLAGTQGVDLSVYLQKNIGAGFFSGEGFILQKISGNGIAFVEVDGSATEIQLAPGQQIIIDTGHLVLAEGTCDIDVKSVKGIKNALFGGVGVFNTVVTGPGKVVLQSMPIIKMANVISKYIKAPSSSSSSGPSGTKIINSLIND